MRTEAASNPTCDHFGFSCRQGILPDLSNSDCLPGRAGGTPVGLGPEGKQPNHFRTRHVPHRHVWMAPDWQGFFPRSGVCSHLQSCVRPLLAARDRWP